MPVEMTRHARESTITRRSLLQSPGPRGRRRMLMRSMSETLPHQPKTETRAVFATTPTDLPYLLVAPVRTARVSGQMQTRTGRGIAGGDA